MAKKRGTSFLISFLLAVSLMVGVSPSASATESWSGFPKVGACKTGVNNRGGHVLGLQAILWIRGYSNQPNSGNDDTGDKWYPDTSRNLDGVAGPYTRNGIYWAQHYGNLGRDSCAGPATWNHLRNFVVRSGSVSCGTGGKMLNRYFVRQQSGAGKKVEYRRIPGTGTSQTSWTVWTTGSAAGLVTGGVKANKGYKMRPGFNTFPC